MLSTFKILLKNTPEDIIAVPFSNVTACQQLLSFISPTKRQPSYTIWLTHIEQIHRFVYHIPNLAWELIEYATEPLSLVYNQVKPIFPGEEIPDEICIRFVTEQPLRKVLPGQQVWLTSALNMLKNKSAIGDWVDREVDMSRTMKEKRPVRMMRVYNENEFSFIS
ncbi:MAG: hypothetical protein WBA23_07000 [Tunicatimonas sp.]|uniref:hypothetical protein n=1 Tax=Tunicatimonas sp. TaxID=1940096 RepID=UPI003C76233D